MLRLSGDSEKLNLLYDSSAVQAATSCSQRAESSHSCLGALLNPHCLFVHAMVYTLSMLKPAAACA